MDSDLKKNDNYYPQVFLKKCKYIEKKVIRQVNDNLSDFPSSSDGDDDNDHDDDDDDDESDKGYIGVG